MRSRLWYTSGFIAMSILMSLVIWQVSFHFGDFGPKDLSQTVIFWAVSTIVFILTVVLGFMLFRTGIKLYIERQSNRGGSRIKTKLFYGALALSFLPVCFMVTFSYAVMNRNLKIWFTRPAEGIKMNFIEINNSLRNQVQETLEARASLLASRPEVIAALQSGAPADAALARFATENRLLAVAIQAKSGSGKLAQFGSLSLFDSPSDSVVVVRKPILIDGSEAGTIEMAAGIPLDIFQTRQEIERAVSRVDQLNRERDSIRWIYILLQAMIALFVLFVATWIALLLARQISVPISALLKGADEIRRGNLGYQVEANAIDELATLVQGFNEMSRQLDVTSRELEDRRRFTEAILESIPTGVISLSPDGRVHRVNRALKKMFPGQWTPEAAAMPKRLEELFSREDTAEIRYMMKRARRTGAATREIELQIEGQTLRLAVTVAALDEKVTSGYVVVLEDLSDLLRAQKAAAWQEVARRVAHEIKNPLTPIALSAERIERQIAKIEVRPEIRAILQDCAATISGEVASVKSLVDEFSQLSRFPAANPQPADLNEVVENALAVFTGRLTGIGITTRFSSLPPVNLDREQFKRVVVNLVDNAAEAMAESPVKELLIETRPAGDSVELILADTGCGVSAEDKEKLFLPYFSTKGRGTGLGLAIANHVLSEHKARIRVEDNKPAGACFYIEIPVPEAVEEIAAEPGAPRPVEQSVPLEARS